MFSKNHKDQNKTFRTVCHGGYVLAVRCRIIENAKTGINYLINIQENAGGVTLLLDKDGNLMFSQMKL